MQSYLLDGGADRIESLESDGDDQVAIDKYYIAYEEDSDDALGYYFWFSTLINLIFKFIGIS